ncbi:dicarboxylate/amino acid:cation symporter [Halobacterium zhouii]|uniref:dicarboxylate/amino acid:cation symporter n=1 Tax=Halobacterium zhouii TaxID=2902624 RepID=UPI001E2CAC0F|nr:dicarboxylate/amino acid:cation symporter [Halobacterium zhouii]
MSAVRAARSAWSAYRDVPLVYRLAAAFALGVVAGLAVGPPIEAIAPLGELFVRLLKMLVLPLVVFTLLSGIRRLTPSRMGRIGGSVVALYLATTAVAAVIGIAVANLVQPGTGVEFTGGEAVSAEAPSLVDVFLGIVPTNPVNAMASGDVLSVIFFVTALGLGLVIARDRADSEEVETYAEAIFAGAAALTEALFNVVWAVMEYGVVGVFALAATSVAGLGLDAVATLGTLVFTVTLGVVVHITVTYLGIITVGVLGRSPVEFLAGAKDAMVTAFATRSSSGTLPVTMQRADEAFGIDESLYGFSLPLGATVNMDGAAIRQAVTAVFAANLFGVPLGLGEQVTLLATVVFVSIGTAGVPGAGLVMLTIILESLGLPLTVVGFVAGVDPLLGAVATMNNVTGDLAVSTVAAKYNDAIDFTTGVWSGGGTEAAATAD